MFESTKIFQQDVYREGLWKMVDLPKNFPSKLRYPSKIARKDLTPLRKKIIYYSFDLGIKLSVILKISGMKKILESIVLTWLKNHLFCPPWLEKV